MVLLFFHYRSQGVVNIMAVKPAVILCDCLPAAIFQGSFPNEPGGGQQAPNCSPPPNKLGDSS